jgi:hypothetical protein
LFFVILGFSISFMVVDHIGVPILIFLLGETVITVINQLGCPDIGLNLLAELHEITNVEFFFDRWSLLFLLCHWRLWGS